MPTAIGKNIAYEPLQHSPQPQQWTLRNRRMALTTRLLWAAIALLMVDSIIEMSFISSMVSWLHRRAGRAFEVNYNGTDFSLHGKPAGLLVNQGHTSNGAAGTAFVLIGLGGILALTFRNHAARRPGTALSRFGLGWWHAWLVFTVLSTFLTLAALIYTFIVTSDHSGQTIDVQLASTLNNHPYPDYHAYPDLQWTPENWFDAILKLDLVSSSDRSNIHDHLQIMRAWRWNLIPLFIIELAMTAIAFWEAIDQRREMRDRRLASGYENRAKRVSA